MNLLNSVDTTIALNLWKNCSLLEDIKSEQQKDPKLKETIRTLSEINHPTAGHAGRDKTQHTKKQPSVFY